MNVHSPQHQLATPAIALSGIEKSFDALKVLEDISLTVAPGEVVALLGMSGCGKSTLLNIIAGLLQPDRGEINVNGTRSDRVRIAYMFQEDRLLPWRSIRANVAFGLEAQNIDRASRRVKADAMLAHVGLSDFAKSWPHQLSGGMRSRVALARSLVVEPRILLMDEPFSKLDPQTRSQMHGELLRLQKIHDTTILFVTHDVEEAVVLADRVVMMSPRPGRIRGVKTLDLPRPRIPTDRLVNEQIRQLRVEA
jgi:NitT/TauT family transport system ATP-binding protein/sulfonate transport system ATP-binding protein